MTHTPRKLPPELEKALSRLKASSPDNYQDLELVIRTLANKMAEAQSTSRDRATRIFIERPSGYVD